MTITLEEIKPFLNEHVAVGVPHTTYPGKLFFYFGILKRVDDTEVTIQEKNGFRSVLVSNIKDIHKPYGGRGR